ncbi:hypothetical protein ACFWR9_08840 [Streptomyces sp. NPDC058534]|uniref:hypothetical protein n=1 Tax=Streptomyces sp. NPDC058534 TaxID=3346541 RepID=UPI00365DBBC3
MTTGNEPPVPAADPPPDTTTTSAVDRPRNARGNFVRGLATVRRDAAAADYLAENPGTTYRELAERFGYADKSQARRGILAAKADVARPAVTKLIQSESDELDDLYLLAREVIERNHVVVSHGKVVCDADGQPLQDDGPRLQAIQTALRIRDQYQNLHGLKQPAQVSVSGTVRYEVVGVDPTDLA